MDVPTYMPAAGINVPQMQRLYRWLVYKRFTIVIYGLSFWAGPIIVAVVLAMLAILFAPYVLFVLYKNGKRGWLLSFAIIAGIPIALTFVPTQSSLIHVFLLYQPLLAFYFYCFVLRYSVADWISDAVPEGETWVETKDKINEPEKISGRWISGGQENL
ncbi:MAG TPA: hypothetical protein VLX91_13885 [Candidatus Acidoferrales bacterium]|nr:hypothetical protein [Candidatus Acidoferrales bacterium]